MRKKVLFVINTMGRAGAERCLLHLLKAWEDETYEISLFSVLGRGELFLEVPSFVRILNESPQAVSVFDYKARKNFAKEILKGLFRRGNLVRNFFITLRLFLWQVKEKKVSRKRLCWKLISDAAPHLAEEFDLAVGYIQGAATYYTLDHVKAKRKIVFLHNEYDLSGYCPLMDRPYYEKADRIYCVSNHITEELKKIFPTCEDKIETFYNFTDADWIRERAKEGTVPEIKRQEGVLCLLTAARLEYVKAFDVAIQTMALMKRKGIKAVWYVIGEGALHNQLEKEIKEEGVDDCFFLLGARENPYPYIAACDIYLQETRFEGFCTSITEAVILGKRVVASDCGGNAEQLSYYGTGILTKLEPQAIVEGIQRAVNEPEMTVDIMCRQRKALERLKGEAG
ncbi:N-acetylgalactosamine-N,N'-diacetylbacillosaminyl-diphospho-undecaprenol 4-alpha-N-acetylgalactosaminyltransferase [Lachnospiraceae bacterium]|nr:N-acetylgalactosamine-N,N'-diacetylbacillosaminyl-diphospho-undecaprenol 4-alpha-N-acetylgalactosaminyltransferase [Lachnospiraceae bacterium]